MNFTEFVTTQFVPRVNNNWNNLKNSLVAAGAQSANITVEEVTTEGVNDLRYRITAKRGNKTVIGYIELTNAGIQNGTMMVAITLYIENNGTQITTSYTVGQPVPYNDSGGLTSLLDKLTNIENLTSTEILTAVRAALGL